MRAIASGRLGTGLHLGVGLGLVALAGYVFVAVVGRVFAGPANAAELSALTSLYLLVNIIGPGLFAALEPELSRAVSAQVAAGEPIRPVARRVALIAVGTLAALALVLALLWPAVLDQVFAQRPSLLVALMVAAAGAAAVYWARGLLSGQQRFGAYGSSLYLEGAARLLPCVVLFLLAVREPAAFGFAFAVGAGVAAVALVPSLRLGPSGVGGPPVGTIGRGLSFLVTATLLTQLVANLAPVVVTYRMPGNAITASAFAVSFVLARIPLMLFAPIQAVLLPHLTRAAELGRIDVVRHRMRQVLLAVGAVGIPSVGLGTLLGPWGVRTLFAVETPPSRLVFGLLAFSAVLIMAALVLQPALVALREQRTVMFAWTAGAVVFLAALLAPIDPIQAALVGQIAGPAVVLGVAAARLALLLPSRP
ncbi:hypothetical protein GCM10017691_62440 [Pseudonocardia petroleophila]|uniref:Membrane protein involved in the export of O-antigen and teichoic acid n=1 Tax=Pseudonocardia petroleophila TaxID=37331 RepID=A0A7G7MLY6_9PSEU|nr:hypothetical protein [Pseudonocardia petroleophila]QNG53797.1 hypothetical protein H6H00_07660 [Pseudonocardia petroleophila]